MRPGNGFQECQINSQSGRANTFDNQTHLEATPPDLHGEDSRDGQFGNARAKLVSCYGYLERQADADIDQIDAFDQGGNGRCAFDLRFQTFSPRFCREKMEGS